MHLYKDYRNGKFDLTAFGLECGGDHCAYFCTPVGAEVIASSGVDGIHYCMVEGFGEMVFAVSPMNGPGEYVHPVAKSFAEFVQLILACKGEAAIEQCWQWSKEQFEIFLKEQESTVYKGLHRVGI